MKKLLPVLPIKVTRDYARPHVSDGIGFADSLESAKEMCRRWGYTVIAEDLHFSMPDHPEPAHIVFVTDFDQTARIKGEIREDESVEEIERDDEVEVVPVIAGWIDDDGFFHEECLLPVGGIGCAKSIVEAIRLAHDEGYRVMFSGGYIVYDHWQPAWSVTVWPEYE